MKTLLAIILFLKCSFGISQTLYVDVLTAPAMIAYSEALKTQQKKTNDNLTAIERGQLLVMGQLQVANSIQQKVVKGLTEVNGTLLNAMVVKDIYSSSEDIIINTKEALNYAQDNPLLSVFAIKHAKEFKTRAVNMVAEVTRILTSGESNMMDSGERQKLLNYIYEEIRLLAGHAFMMKQAMYWAKINGIWRSINPFAGWINQDVRIMQDIMMRAQTL